MGIDAIITCRPAHSGEVLSPNGRFLLSPYARPTPYGATHEVRSDYYGRYFSASYPRGYWPNLREQIVWAMEHGDVWYLSDMVQDAGDYTMYPPTQEDHEEFGKSHLVTPAMLQELDEAWLWRIRSP